MADADEPFICRFLKDQLLEINLEADLETIKIENHFTVRSKQKASETNYWHW